jgi:hypothetical protein
MLRAEPRLSFGPGVAALDKPILNGLNPWRRMPSGPTPAERKLRTLSARGVGGSGGLIGSGISGIFGADIHIIKIQSRFGVYRCRVDDLQPYDYQLFRVPLP